MLQLLFAQKSDNLCLQQLIFIIKKELKQIDTKAVFILILEKAKAALATSNAPSTLKVDELIVL